MSKRDEAIRVAREAKAMLDEADRAGRELTLAERGVIQGKLDRANGLKTHIAVEEFGLNMGVASNSTQGQPGDVFVQSKGWQEIADPGSRPQRWSTGLVEVSSGPMYKAGTVLEGSQGGGFVTVPQVVPGVVDKLFEPPAVQDLIPSLPATTSSVRYMVEGTATNNAAGVAEGGLKPASDLAVSTIDEPIKKLATVLTVSDELLEDAASVQTYINSRLSLFIQLEEERQLLRGSGTNDLVGFFNRGIPVYAGGTAAGNKAVQLFKCMMGLRGTAHLDATGIVLDPSDWQDIRLLTDTAGQYFGGGPFTSAYGGQQGPVEPFAGASIWGVPVRLSSTCGRGTALVGAFSTAAQVYRRGGVGVEATNAHSDYFQRNLAMIRAEERLGLGLYRPAAFVEARIA